MSNTTNPLKINGNMNKSTYSTVTSDNQRKMKNKGRQIKLIIMYTISDSTSRNNCFTYTGLFFVLIPDPYEMK